MKNNFKIIFFFTIVQFLIFLSAQSNDSFNFDVTEVEITEKGNKFIGKKRGIITTDDGLVLNADEFTYYKNLNILNAIGNVKITDTIKNTIIYTDEITYLKNTEIIFTNGYSIYLEDELIIYADNFEYNKILNIINANGDVKIENPVEDYVIYSDNINYFRNKNKFVTQGKTKSIIEKKYNFYSSDVQFLRDKKILSSTKNIETIVTDDDQKLYKFDEFEYFVNEDLLKANNLEIISENFLQNGFSDSAKFSNGFFRLKSKDYTAKDTKIRLKKDTFGNFENDSRLTGVSSFRKNDVLTVNKGVFTSCNQSMDCPAWAIRAKKIKHDQKKRRLIYDHAILKIYSMPVMYLPKFFHPDPSVKRQSGFLQPILNNSDILGSSIYIPYFHVISDNKDLTFQTSVFEEGMVMFQNEYRQVNKNSSFMGDFAYTYGYKSEGSNNRNSISHFFSKYDLDLDLEKFDISSLKIFLEKVSQDTYLKVFEKNLIDTEILPRNQGSMHSGMNITLDNEAYKFKSGINIYESLGTEKNSDRFSFGLPYYNYAKTPLMFKYGQINFTSNGSNNLNDTNNLVTEISNDIGYENYDLISKRGIKNNFNLYFKNLNIVAKNDKVYRSSPQYKLSNIMEASTSLPLYRLDDENTNYIIPKLSLRFNPTNMSNKAKSNRNIDVDNIFSIDRLGLGNTFEEGQSLTLGVDYKKESIQDLNKYFELKLGTVFRDTKEDRIPLTSTIDRRGSNLFGSITNSFSDFYKLDYDFSVDNDLSTFEYNSIKSTFYLPNITSEFLFVERNGTLGDTNFITNETSVKFNDNNFLKFKTSKNRKINLTEYYDFIYEYQNDCLSAGIKYKKTFYEDRELKPDENLVLSITIKPFTSYEYKVNQKFYNPKNAK